MILEYAQNGNLFFMNKNRKCNEKEIFKYFQQTCNVIEYLHKNNIIHRDIKVIIFQLKMFKFIA